jgi:hypothetical protein
LAPYYSPSLHFPPLEELLRASPLPYLGQERYAACSIFIIFLLVINIDCTAWEAVASRFWHLSKYSDIRLKSTFVEEWATFVTLVDTQIGDTCDLKKKKSAMAWLRKLGERADKFAACFVYDYETFHIFSTQRSEAIHSTIQTWCRASSLLTDLVKNLDIKSHSILSRAFTDAFRKRFALETLENSSDDPSIVPMKGLLSAHAHVPSASKFSLISPLLSCLFFCLLLITKSPVL